MHATRVPSVREFSPTLAVGDMQTMSFPAAEDCVPGDGPLWMTPEERLASMVDTYTDNFVDDEKNAQDLLVDLHAAGVNTIRKRYNKKELVDLATQHNIPLKRRVRELASTGWCGKPKGKRQILLERGLIDINNLDRYTESGSKRKNNSDFDEDGNLKEEAKKYCMNWLLENECQDFREEMSDLEYLLEEISADSEVSGACNFSLIFTPKYHCELAGEGIEYSWGMAKKIFRGTPLAQRKSYEQFKACVADCLSKVSKENCQRFAARARRYMLVYQHRKDFDGELPDGFDENEKIFKAYKSHRDAGVFDGKFIADTIKASIGVQLVG